MICDDCAGDGVLVLPYLDLTGVWVPSSGDLQQSTSGIVKEHIIVPVANMYIGSGRGIGMSMTMPFCCDESRSKPAVAKVLLSVLAKFPVLPMLVLGKV